MSPYWKTKSSPKAGKRGLQPLFLSPSVHIMLNYPRTIFTGVTFLILSLTGHLSSTASNHFANVLGSASVSGVIRTLSPYTSALSVLDLPINLVDQDLLLNQS